LVSCVIVLFYILCMIYKCIRLKIMQLQRNMIPCTTCPLLNLLIFQALPVTPMDISLPSVHSWITTILHWIEISLRTRWTPTIYFRLDTTTPLSLAHPLPHSHRMLKFSKEVLNGIEVFGEFLIGVGFFVELQFIYVWFSAFSC